MRSAARCGPVAFTVVVALLLFFVALSTFHVDVARAVTTAELQSFRCMRSFSSLTRFSPSAMKVAENCVFGPVRVVNASAHLRCSFEEAAGGAESVGASKTLPSSCNVTVRVEFQVEQDADDPLFDRHGVSSEDDSYRFSLQIRALNDSVVHYKGNDQNGYSMCCSFLEGGKCSWEGNEQQQQQIGLSHAVPATRREPSVVSCPLHDALPHGTPLRGVVTKPLHRLVLASWEARLEFWRGARESREVLGRLRVPFRLTEGDIATATSAEAGGMRGDAGPLVAAGEEAGAAPRGDL